jgi:hypothetical protein
VKGASNTSANLRPGASFQLQKCNTAKTKKVRAQQPPPLFLSGLIRTSRRVMTVAMGNHHADPSSEIRRIPAIAAIRGPTKGNRWLVRGIAFNAASTGGTARK